MKISLSPQRSDYLLKIEKNGDCLTINGIEYDFSQLSEGDILPYGSVICEWIVSDVARINGELELTIKLPHSADASVYARFPEPLINPPDGVLELPQ